MNTTRRFTGGLFWKLLLALWLSMALSIAGSVAYFEVFGRPSRPSANVGEKHRRLVPVVPVVSGGIAILIIGTGLAWTLSRPLNQLREAVRRVGEGRYDTRVDARLRRRRDEIGDLGLEFDAMTARLQQMTESRRVLFHDISHELRSPLARMQAAIGLLQQSPAQTPAMIERLAREAERMDALIGELMTLHRLDDQAPQLSLETVDVIELLHALASDAAFEAASAGKTLQLDAEGQFVAPVDGELLYRAMENVIRNAIRFAPAGSAIEVRAARDASAGLLVEVSDRGTGIPDALLERVFDPFVRIDGEGQGTGTGLGLAIARRALRAHGGSVEAAPREGGGLCVRMRLPAQRMRQSSDLG